MQRAYAPTRMGQVHYARTGDPARPPLILLTKTARTWRLFAPLAAELARDFDVIAFDYPGTGYSDPLPAGASFEDIAAALIDALDALGLKQVSVYGLLTGNKIATAMAAGWPERVARLILVGQSHSLVPSQARRLETVGKRRREVAGETPHATAVLRWADAWSRVSALWWDNAALARLADTAVRRRQLHLAVEELLTTEAVTDLYRANHAYDLEAGMRRVRCPTLVVEVATPAEDRSVGRQGAAVCALLADARLQVLERPDEHGITLENEVALVAGLLREFLGTAPTP